jgi:carbamoyl-phosphate synthase small subunit
LGCEASGPANGEARIHVVAYDYGLKRNILWQLAAHGCRVTVVPATTPAVDYGIEVVRALLGRVPIFCICLGHQILGLALGGKTYMLK